MEDIQDVLAELAPQSKPARLTSRAALAQVALHRALGAEGKRLLRRKGPLALIVIVPSAQWIEPIKKAIVALSTPTAEYVNLEAKGKKRADLNAAISLALARSGRIVGLASAIDYHLSAIPDSLAAVMTHEFVVPSPDAATIAAAMKLALSGNLPRSLRDLHTQNVEFDVLCACMPAGGTKRQAAEAIARAIQRTKASAVPKNRPLPSLESAIEYGEARDWGLELKRDIEDVRRNKIGWDAVDRGVVLYGEPGTGKTTFAKILGESCGLTTIVKSTADLFTSNDSHLDDVIKAQRRMFQEARDLSPSLLFIDEIDAYPDPYTISSRGKDWWMPVIMDLQLQLDSAVSERDGVIVCGATNRVRDVSIALLRPGRLERAVYIGPPTIEGLVNIVRTHLGPDLAGTDLRPLALIGQGATAADAMDWVRAARRKARRDDRPLAFEDLIEQARPSDERPEWERYRVAVHEAGHAMIGIMLGFKLDRVSIAARGASAGHTVFTLEETILVKETLEASVIKTLAGRAAEIIVLGSASRGAGGGDNSDLASATKTLAAMRASLGLSDRLFWHATEENVVHIARSDAVLRDAIEDDLQRLHASALDMVRTHQRAIEILAKTLMYRVVLTGEDVSRLFGAPRSSAA